MNRKRSMRIFWLSFWLLLISGAVIIAVVYARSHKTGTSNQNAASDHAKQPQVTSEAENTDIDLEPSVGTQPWQAQNGHTNIEDTQTDTQLQQASGRAAAYRYELKVKNGYLEIYYYHTEELFMHTGIPFRSLTLEQKHELRNGKYFQSEEDLYGYLESCTS